jgi:hypothetical protein
VVSVSVPDAGSDLVLQTYVHGHTMTELFPSHADSFLQHLIADAVAVIGTMVSLLLSFRAALRI